ncbi:hypothetical protein CROQUDRAFT_88993 [Cronartium quercuum f. sp. fusiforme G11]|uniref:Uncharacterized protein n=1 Tax=Cronartium quercuum f. sp. fusiforme G11 TaxID=708437 RepID=A0A9P6TER8_9BASI|nr:hypothetical protein CROQUDRAFT_88993 [Cronartium quercuum f. sp. fusiforme G11]
MGDITSAAVVGFSFATIIFIIGLVWVMVTIRRYIGSCRAPKHFKTFDLEAAALPSAPPISRPLRLLPVGQTFTVVKSPLPTTTSWRLDTPMFTPTTTRLKRSVSMPSSSEHFPERQRTIVWFDELQRPITRNTTITTITTLQPELNGSVLDSSSNSQSDSISVRSKRLQSINILPQPPEVIHILKRESSLSSVSKLWLTYQANQI